VTFATGEKVMIECKGVNRYATVELASSNGKSLALVFEAIIDGHVGMMPVLLDDDGVYRSIVNGVAVKINRAP
jgi:hypothetical protein